ncbi:rhomboid family intramembrane serine protease [Loktanella sp. S4079]|uniref:rhomboid family intramembrane serine protease n=1 Tax=Loktanella sp. S4079 TaxID=579483 RepID=UPI0005FA02A0|nr:rhomboid family intramembrane serine protease [Loktanella sp. S4079]KJZ18600.1 hypothetical protein TW80_14420 [Loktanella sp. S4079]
MTGWKIPYITLVTVGLSLFGYWRFGPAMVPVAPIPLMDIYLNAFKHGNLGHLLTNCVMVLIAGYETERKVGSYKTFALIAGCIVIGSTVQFVMVDHRFVGISSAAYGLVSFALLSHANPRHYTTIIALIAAIIALEAAAQPGQLALYTHVTSALIGGSYAMFGSLFGKKGPHLKPMQMIHLPKVLPIIAQTDEDDAAEAEQAFLQEGFDGMFVLVEGSEVLGVTGYSPDEQVPDVMWLSWTYLRQDQTGAGLGSQMLNNLLGKLKDMGIRKLFIATSDYDDFGKQIYAAAHKMYAEFGARIELTVPAYHSPTEAKIVYGLENPEFDAIRDTTPAPNTGLSITGSGVEPETDDVYGLSWEESPVGLAGMEFAKDKAIERGARQLVLAIPSDLSDANSEALQSHNFRLCGRLSDYYKLGLDQVWWLCSIGDQ